MVGIMAGSGAVLVGCLFDKLNDIRRDLNLVHAILEEIGKDLDKLLGRDRDDEWDDG